LKDSEMDSSQQLTSKILFSFKDYLFKKVIDFVLVH
jgi:hypothetical protein